MDKKYRKPMWVVLSGLCAAIWIFNVVNNIMTGQLVGITVMNSVCAVLWTVAFIISLCTLLKKK